MGAVEFYGQEFDLAGAPSEFALMEFAAAASEGQDGDSLEGMASVMRLLKECIAPTDWSRFRKVAREHRATAELLMPVIQAAFEQAAERPTGQSADSSAGLSPTPEKSEPSAAEKASAAFPGRPDLQRAVLYSVAS